MANLEGILKVMKNDVFLATPAGISPKGNIVATTRENGHTIYFDVEPSLGGNDAARLSNSIWKDVYSKLKQNIDPYNIHVMVVAIAEPYHSIVYPHRSQMLAREAHYVLISDRVFCGHIHKQHGNTTFIKAYDSKRNQKNGILDMRYREKRPEWEGPVDNLAAESRVSVSNEVDSRRIVRKVQKKPTILIFEPVISIREYDRAFDMYGRQLISGVYRGNEPKGGKIEIGDEFRDIPVVGAFQSKYEGTVAIGYVNTQRGLERIWFKCDDRPIVRSAYVEKDLGNSILAAVNS